MRKPTGLTGHQMKRVLSQTSASTIPAPSTSASRSQLSGNSGVRKVGGQFAEGPARVAGEGPVGEAGGAVAVDRPQDGGQPHAEDDHRRPARAAQGKLLAFSRALCTSLRLFITWGMARFMGSYM